MSELLRLAERCEKATGPSRHLDTQIFILLDPNAQHIVGHKPGRFPREAIYGPRSDFWGWATDESREPPVLGDIPKFTASLDAAMTLVPEGFRWWFSCGWIRPTGEPPEVTEAFAKVWQSTEHDLWRGDRCSTPALALTAAALRAIASQEPTR